MSGFGLPADVDGVRQAGRRPCVEDIGSSRPFLKAARCQLLHTFTRPQTSSSLPVPHDTNSTTMYLYIDHIHFLSGQPMVMTDKNTAILFRSQAKSSPGLPSSTSSCEACLPPCPCHALPPLRESVGNPFPCCLAFCHLLHNICTLNLAPGAYDSKPRAPIQHDGWASSFNILYLENALRGVLETHASLPTHSDSPVKKGGWACTSCPCPRSRIVL